jgi:hypothetical protein
MSIFLTQLCNAISKKNMLAFFISVFFLLNVLQASFTGLHADEAYYWVYSQFLDWGYFDHPPMVALFIKFGESFFHHPLALRLMTIFSSSLTSFMLWQIVKKYQVNIWHFIVLISAVLIFHVYAFITTPDVPLLLFSVLFLYVYQLYLKEDKLKWALFLGVISAALMLSKYHGILLIIFTLVSNLKLFTRKSFYLTIVLGISLCLPHLYWQYLNDYPSFYYHLIDRSVKPYLLNDTFMYLLGQPLMMGPLVGWLFFYYGFKLKTANDKFLIALKFVSWGVLIFFFISTFKGSVQAQWPLIEFIALFILACVYSQQKPTHLFKFKWLFAINLFLILFARLAITGIITPLNKIAFVSKFQNYELWAKEIQTIAKENNVIFLDAFQEPSFYNYYTHSLKGVAYNSINYRQTQYDLWPLEDSLQNHKAMLLKSGESTLKEAKEFNTVKGIHNYEWINRAQFYPKIKFVPINLIKDWRANEERLITFKLINPYPKAIDFSSNKQQTNCTFQYVYHLNGSLFKIEPFSKSASDLKIEAQQNKIIQLKIKAPAVKGKYKLFISIKTNPFSGTRNSKMIDINVN